LLTVRPVVKLHCECVRGVLVREADGVAPL
jgi:hypothetical protein